MLRENTIVCEDCEADDPPTKTQIHPYIPGRSMSEMVRTFDRMGSEEERFGCGLSTEGLVHRKDVLRSAHHVVEPDMNS